MASDSKYKVLLKDTIIFALGNIGSKVIIFFLVPFYTHYLTPEEYGISDLVFTISQLLIPFFSIVIFDAVIRFALFRKDRPQDALLIGLFVWFCGSILALCFTPILSFYSAISNWKWFVIAYIIINNLLSIELNYLKSIDKNLSYSIICIIQTLTLALLNILLVAYFRKGIEGYLLSYIFSAAIGAFIALLVGKIIPALFHSKYDHVLAKEMLVYSAPLILNNLSWWIIQSSDKLMLETMIGAAALGIFNVASKIPSLISVFVTIFQQAWGISSIKEMDSTNDSSFYSNVFSYLSIFAYFACILLTLIIYPFMNLYVRSNEYGEVWRYVPLLLLSAVFSALAAYSGSMYGALKKSFNNMTTTLTAAIINLIVNLIAIHYIGIWGAIIGTLVSYYVLALVRIVDIKRYIDLYIEWKTIISNTIIVLVQAIFVSVLSPIMGIALSMICLALYLFINRSYLKKLKQFLN